MTFDLRLFFCLLKIVIYLNTNWLSLKSFWMISHVSMGWKSGYYLCLHHQELMWWVMQLMEPGLFVWKQT